MSRVVGLGALGWVVWGLVALGLVAFGEGASSSLEETGGEGWEELESWAFGSGERGMRREWRVGAAMGCFRLCFGYVNSLVAERLWEYCHLHIFAD